MINSIRLPLITILFIFSPLLLILYNYLFRCSSVSQITMWSLMWRILWSRANTSSWIRILHPHVCLMNWMFLNILILTHIMVSLFIGKSCWYITFIWIIFNFFIISNMRLKIVKIGWFLAYMLWLNFSLVLLKRLKLPSILSRSVGMIRLDTSMRLFIFLLVDIYRWRLH